MKMFINAAMVSLLLFPLACSESAVEIEVLAAPSREGWDSAAASPGFTLVRSLRSKRAHLVDMSGTSVHSWTSSGVPSGGRYLTERGTLLQGLEVQDQAVFRGGGKSGGIEELDWDGTLLWTFNWHSEEGLSHHDIEELPNGNVLMIAWDRYTREEALASGRDPELLGGQEFWPDAVYEIKPTRPEGGEIVWSWHAWDHLVQNFDSKAPNFAEPSSRPERIDINGDRNPEPPSMEEEKKEQDQMAALGYIGDEPDDAVEMDAEQIKEAAFKARIKDADWMHTNGIDYNASLDQIVISVRRFDEVWIIDHSTTTEEAASSNGGRYGKGGDLLYRWGNPYAYGMGSWEDRQLLGQHNVQWIPEGMLGGGSLLVFDNGTEKDRAWSVVKEWWPPRDVQGNYLREEGRPFGPVQTSWSYTAEEPTDFFSSFISGVQRLPNGNTLVCAGKQGWVFEVSPAGELMWDWLNPYGLDPEVDEPNEDPGSSELNPTALFRAVRYGSDHPALRALREKGALIPGDPGAGPATNQFVKPEESPEELPEEASGESGEGD
ncbi:MAG: hypothetical protein ACI8QS_002619 [Planctomycetota bacterium]|jgi:hypothetical protein